MIINDLPCPKGDLEILANTVMLGKTFKIVFILSLSPFNLFFEYFGMCTVHQWHINSYISGEYSQIVLILIRVHSCNHVETVPGLKNHGDVCSNC